MPAPNPPIRPAALSSASARAAVVQLGQQRFDALAGLVILDVQIMDQQQVDARQAEALQAVLERAHHAVIAVVEPHLERQPAGPKAAIIGLGVMHRVHGAADLGGQHEVAARLPIKRAAEAVLALRQAVPGRRVVVADAGVPGGLQCGDGLRFGDDLEQIAETGAAETELRDLDLSQAKAAADLRVHAFAPLSGNAPACASGFMQNGSFGPFYTKVIAATASEAPHVLDGLLYQTDDPAAATGPF